MLNLDYPDPNIPGPGPPKSTGSRPPASSFQFPVSNLWLYRAYAWLLDSERPAAAVFFLYVGLLFCVSGALGDWRWFVWGAALPILAAGGTFLAVSVMLVFTRFIIRLLM